MIHDGTYAEEISHPLNSAHLLQVLRRHAVLGNCSMSPDLSVAAPSDDGDDAVSAAAEATDEAGVGAPAGTGINTLN